MRILGGNFQLLTTYPDFNMHEKFDNLAAAINIFSEEYDLSLDQNLRSLDLSVQQGYIDKALLKEELDNALSDPDFDWVGFAFENRLIVRDKWKYTNDGMKDYVKSLIWDYLYPING